jgi:tetratricopeptide (TPR) repeat protein
VALALPASAAPAEQSQLDGSETLFTVLAAINSAGYDADLTSTANNPLRQMLRSYLAKQNIPVVDDLKRYFAAHKQKNNGAELSQYVSFALSIDGQPNFNFRFKPNELPPDVVPMVGLNELLARFYTEANIADLWAKSQPEVEKIIAAYQPLVAQGVVQANAYLRNPTSGSLGRRFQVIVDVLGAPNQIQSRSYRDDYYVVVTPSVEPQADEVRHAYLHYLLDPLVLKNAEAIDKKRSLFDYAQGAQALEDVYKEDFLLLATESLIKAVEARLTRGAEKKQAIVDQALREGFILTGAFFDNLPAYEKQDQALRFYFKDVVDAISLKTEVARLDQVKFVRERATKEVKTLPPPPPPKPTGTAKALIDADDLYRDRKLDASRQAYLQILKAPDEQSAHAKAYYGLARIAALQRDGELAERMFQKALDLGPDGETRAWCLVYLGRMADAHGEREQALERYKAALGVKDSTPGARQAAEQGLKQSFSNKK